MRCTILQWVIFGSVLPIILGGPLQQSFILKPQDTEVIEGETVELQCVVANQAGAVQWSKDGFVLGFDRTIPGFTRYQMLGNGEDGVHTLQIEQAKIDDDAEYQCQVGPAGDNKAIRADARLTVLLKPMSINMADRKNGTAIEIRQSQTLTLTCTVTGGKPAAQIKWYRKNVELRPDSVETREEEMDEHRKNTISTLTLTPNEDDNGATYFCEAVHPALTTPLRTGVELSVQFPPGPPEIAGYQDGETVRRGDTLTLTCISRGGNPLAQLVWFKNDEQVDFSYVTSGRESTNTYTFIVDAEDNNAVYRCEASNIVTLRPMVAMVKLTVQFAPTKVTITGPKEAKAGDTVTMVCTTERSNPPAEISWVVDGRPIVAGNTVTADPQGGWVTTANVTVTITSQERNMKMFSCYAVNQALGETIVESAVLSILYAPNPPNIFGYSEGTSIRAGNVQRLTCVVQGGNPLPSLKWFKGNKEIKSTLSTSGNVASSEIAVITQDSDNGAEYRCEASNSATPTPLVTSIKLTVHFPPSGVTIKVKPKRPKAGQKVTLVCESASSNPESTITWWKDGFLVPSVSNGTSDAPYGGKSSKNLLRINVTSDDDGAVYTCQAMNKILQQSVHDAVTLSVQYKPEFSVGPMEKYDIVEGEALEINLTAKGNPDVITYRWMKDGIDLPTSKFDNAIGAAPPRIYAMGSVMNVTIANRDDSGQYKCKATNDEGETEITVVLNVQYAASIVRVTEVLMAEPESNAYLECQVDANPLPEDLIQWKRENFDMDRTRQTQVKGVSSLIIYNVSKEDSGKFECIANNGIGEEATMDVHLVVKHKPVIDRSPQIAKAASENGDTGRLVCRAQGAPNVTFTWSIEGETINVEAKSEKYDTILTQIDLVTWESVLLVKDVKSQDYGPYECVARNELGFDSNKIKLDKTSKPDPPLALKILNITHNSMYLSWVPGFDGGLTQSYRIRFKPTSAKYFSYTDVFPPNATSFTVTGLELATEYAFNILAFNEKGESDYTTDIVKAITLSEPLEPGTMSPIPEVLSGKGEIPRIMIISVSVVGSSLLILNIILVVCFVRRRRKKRLEEESDQSSSKAATIEMYAPSSFNETVNGETLSSTSEKSEAYSGDAHSTVDYIEDHGKPAATTYLIDQGDGTYIPDGMVPQYSPYRYPDQLSVTRHAIIENSPKLSNKHLHEAEEDNYADALRKNAYNQKLGSETVAYGKVGYPPPPPGRTAASGGDSHYNIGPDARYVSYPVGSSVPRQATSTPPLLSTFNPNVQGPPLPPPPDITAYTITVPPPRENGSVPTEMDGHLV